MLLKSSDRHSAIRLKRQQRRRNSLHLAPRFLSPHDFFNLHQSASTAFVTSS
jgi:hypothetical protein